MIRGYIITVSIESDEDYPLLQDSKEDQELILRHGMDYASSLLKDRYGHDMSLNMNYSINQKPSTEG